MSDRSTQKQTKSMKPLIIVLIIILAILSGFGFFYMGRLTSQPLPPPSTPSSTTTLTATNLQGTATDLSSNDETIKSGTIIYQTKQLTTKNDTIVDEKQSIFSSTTELQPTKTAVADSVKELDVFFVYLDQETYIEALNLPNDTKVTFGNLIQKLVNNPPVITGESDDLYTLLKNTAHFFRVLGGSNIQLLKAIVTNEEPKLENTAAELFVLLNDQEALQNHFNVTLPETALYDYSCFLMNTMGGRLYMFRRDLELRMLINYYSLLFANQAQQEGRNRHGIDIRPFLIDLIDQMENHGQNLKMRDSYLETLYLLEKQWD